MVIRASSVASGSTGLPGILLDLPVCLRAGLARGVPSAGWRRDSSSPAAGGFIRTRPEFAWPNIQFHFLPVAINYNGSNAVSEHGFHVEGEE